MAAIKRFLRFLFLRLETPFELAFGARHNPFAWLGAFGWYFFWIAAVSGIYLYLFFDTGITNAYESVEYMTVEQWYAAGIARSLHRYASDALVVVLVLHIAREFSLDRLRGKRFFAWVSGVPILWFIYLCGISGYWLVWDKLAQYIAIASAQWLDSLPIFGEPIANNFLDSSTLGDRFFTLMVFIHIFAPLFMLFLMWIHIQRYSAPRVNPPRPLAIGTGLALLAVSLIKPATSQAPANLDIVPATLGIDWFYLAAYPLLDVIPGGQLWLILIGGTVFLALMPWLPRARPEAAAAVSLENCNGCGRCVEDCPYSAISLEPRSDGLNFEAEAVVNVDNCVSCGICAGACPTATPFRRAGPLVPGIDLPDRSIAELRDRSLRAAGELTGRQRRLLVYACQHANAGSLSGDDCAVLTLPCVGMLPPAFIDFALSRDLADGIVLAGCAEGDCFHRFGDEWVRQRVARQRDPYLRQRVPRGKVHLSWLPPHRSNERRLRVAAFQASLDDGATRRPEEGETALGGPA